MQCRAKAKHSQMQCRQPVVPGMEVCRFHGGLTPRGPASATYKSGRYSKFLPSRMLARYRAAESDRELTSLRSELALVDARLADLLGRVDSGESGSLWRALRKAHRAFKISRESGNVEHMRDALAELNLRIEAGVSDYEAWRELQTLVEQRRKLADSESRRLGTLHQMISAERAMLLIGVVVDIIRRHVSDPTVLNAIAIDVQRLGEVGQAAYGLHREDGDI
jgi:hypothetical protein